MTQFKLGHYQKEYYAANVESGRVKRREYGASHREDRKKYRAANLETLRADWKKWFAVNEARVRLSWKNYKESNLEKIRARAREYSATHRQEIREYGIRNRKRITENGRKWTKLHPEQARVNFVRGHQRRRDRGGEVELTVETLNVLLKMQSGRCANIVCGKKIGQRYHVDHIIPLAKFNRVKPGENPNAVKNLQLLCKPCNQRKSVMLPEKWAREQGFLALEARSVL